jgi:hypothetical protein
MNKTYARTEEEIITKIITTLHEDKDVDTVFYDFMQKAIRCNYGNYEITVSVELCEMSHDVIIQRENNGRK